MKADCKLTISRKWDHPYIKTAISLEGIGVEIALDDFLTAVIEELGSVRYIVRDATFKSRLSLAVDNVLREVKRETAKTIGQVQAQ